MEEPKKEKSKEIQKKEEVKKEKPKIDEYFSIKKNTKLKRNLHIFHLY